MIKVGLEAFTTVKQVSGINYAGYGLESSFEAFEAITGEEAKVLHLPGYDFVIKDFVLGDQSVDDIPSEKYEGGLLIPREAFRKGWSHVAEPLRSATIIEEAGGETVVEIFTDMSTTAWTRLRMWDMVPYWRDELDAKVTMRRDGELAEGHLDIPTFMTRKEQNAIKVDNPNPSKPFIHGREAAIIAIRNFVETLPEDLRQPLDNDS